MKNIIQNCLPAFAGVAELVDAMDLKSISTYMEYRFDSGPRQFRHLFVYKKIMWFIVRRTWDLNTNERMISFYKKELRSSHILDKAKKQEHYGTKWYRKFVSYDFPSFRRYNRMKAVVSNAYKTNKKKYNTLAQLWKIA